MKLVTRKERKFLDASVLAAGGQPPALGTIASASKVATQAASVAVDVPALLVDFNALLVKLKAAGIML